MVPMSPLLRDIVCGIYKYTHPEPYRIHKNGGKRRMGYFIGDGIYLSWKILSKPIYTPHTVE